MIDPWILALFCLTVLMACAAVRLVLGPTAPDRVIALDTVNTLVIASMILLGVVFKEIIFVDVAIVYGLLSFVSTLYIAKYIGGSSDMIAVEIIIYICLSIGVIFNTLGVIGLLRFPDLYTRMHATTKATTFGSIFTSLAVIVYGLYHVFHRP